MVARWYFSGGGQVVLWWWWPGGDGAAAHLPPRNDFEGQAVLINCLLRNYLHYNLYNQVPPDTTCHSRLSPVTCHLPPVGYHLSPVTCHLYRRTSCT